MPPAPIFQGQRASSKDLRVIFIQNLLMRVDGEKMKKVEVFCNTFIFTRGFQQGGHRYKGASILSYCYYLVIYTGVSKGIAGRQKNVFKKPGSDYYWEGG